MIQTLALVLLILLLPISIVSDEREVLIDLYTSLGGEFWNAKTNWLEGTDICLWQGVSCQRGTEEVESLDLSSNNLDGNMDILRLLRDLKSLRRLNLGNNDFDIYIDADITGISSNIEEMILDGIDIDLVFIEFFNRVSFPELTDLSLVSCDIGSAFPFFDKVSLPKLVKLDLDDNDFDSFPATLTMPLDNLEFFSISKNEIEGTLPAYFQSFQKLRFLFLKSNYLKGDLNVLSQLPLLESIDISDQLLHHNCSKGYGFNGTLPPFNIQPHLRRVNLAENCFSGTIPTNLLEVVDVGTFEFFIANKNQLTGTIPSTPVLLQLPSNSFFFADNKITGVDSTLCENTEFSCSSVLCPPSTYNAIGRQVSQDEPCTPCAENIYYGKTHCGIQIYDDDDAADDDYDDQYNENDATNNIVPITTFDILKKLYEQTDGPNWFQKDNWLVSDDFCNWSGVQCDEGDDIATLVLTSNNLRGVVPNEIFLLPELHSLNLNKNQITLNFSEIRRANKLTSLDVSETNITDLKGIGTAPKLIDLHLEQNNFTGLSIPTELWNIQSLEDLRIDNCGFNGNISSEIGRAAGLKLLSAENNQLSGTFPDQMAMCTELIFLNMKSNKLSGTIPAYFDTFSQLSSLDLSHNNLDGPLPSFATQLNIRRFDLSYNSLTGDIPSNFFTSVDKPAVELLNVCCNKLTGQLPASINGIRLPKFTDNQITSIDPALGIDLNGVPNVLGTNSYLCPPGFFNMQGLQTGYSTPCNPCPTVIYFGSTTCPGPESATPSHSPSVHVITVPLTSPPIIPPQQPIVSPESSPQRDTLINLYNTLNGGAWLKNANWLSAESFCTWQGVTCTATEQLVQRLELQSNNLEGEINLANLLKMLPDLTSLDLENNPLTIVADAPDMITTNMEELNLNRIDVGNVYENLFTTVSFPLLRELFMVSCGMAGEFPFFSRFFLPKIEKLDFDDNNFNHIPSSFDVLEFLEFLSMNNNIIEGEIPKKFGSKFPNLKYLYMSQNYFKGEIPVSFEKLVSLEVVDLGEQLLDGDCARGFGLTGTLPAFDAHPFIRRFDVSYNCLEGPISTNFLNKVSVVDLEHIDLNDNLLTGTIPSIEPFLKISEDNLDVTGNHFIALDVGLCDSRKFGCNSISCPLGTYNEDGAQVEIDEPCLLCAANTYLGMDDCKEHDIEGVSSSTTLKPAAPQIQEIDVLKMLYQSTGGETWKNKDGWMLDNSDYCLWFGIKCDIERHVLSISLPANNLIGAVPTDIYSLQSLSELNLSENAIQIGFNGIEFAKELRTIDLSSTGIANLDGLSAVNKLTELNIESNMFTNEIPDEIFNLNYLENLRIGNNGFSGTIANDIQWMEELKLFTADNNQFSGTIPEFFRENDMMHTLRLNSNRFSGGLPAFFEEMDSLAFLDLSHNQLEGPLLPFENHRELRRLDLSFNSITGTISPSFLSLVDKGSFEFVNLMSNKVSGEMPASLLGLKEVKVQDNMISSINPVLFDISLGGTVSLFGVNAVLCPPQTYNILGRQESDSSPCLPCSTNPYYGTTTCSSPETPLLPEGIPSLTPSFNPSDSPSNLLPTLQTLQPSFSPSSSLVASTPPSLHSLPLISSSSPSLPLISSSNPSLSPSSSPIQIYTSTSPSVSKVLVSGEDDRKALMTLYQTCHGAKWYRRDNWTSDQSICTWEGIKCAKNTELVESISLAANNIQCKPPSALFTLSCLKKLILYNNPLRGFDFEGIHQAQNLTTLLLDATGIQSIAGIETATQLKKLNLRFNKLKGNLPIELKKLKSLSYLSLSDNMFEGPLPDIFEDMNNLEILLLESNRFSGELGTFKLPKNLKIVDLSDNEFNGPVEPSFLANFPSHGQLEVDLSDNMLTGIVPSSFARFERINLFLKGNFINGIAPELCIRSLWNDGDVGVFGCDAILCPSKEWAPVGRSTKTNLCEPCRSSNYYGSVFCESGVSKLGANNSSMVRIHVLLYLFLIFAITLFLVS